MKAAIHPPYTNDATLTCSCGNVITTGSTLPQISIELCSNCHPFYTGKQNLVDTAGRVDRFTRMQSKKEESHAGKKVKNEKRAAQKAAKKAQKPVLALEA